MTASPRDEEIRHGSRIGRFVIIGELGSGGMGVVYVAHDRELDRQVALKVLRNDRPSSQGSTEDTREERTRMLREGQAMARITHPNVITVYEVGVEGSLVFLAQELMDAGTLGTWLEREHTEAEILEKFIAAGRGLAAAHAAGLVHRDFKPDNVLLGKDGRVRVADFGLARALGSEGEALGATRSGKPGHAEAPSHSPMNALTRTGAVMGTPMYMAPEQHNGERADERSDQFSFCVALYHALYDDWPFAGQSVVALADAVIAGRIEPRPKGTRVPERLRRVVLRGLRPSPADRYPSIDALLADLTHVPSRALPRVALVAGLLVLVGGALVGGYVLRSGSPDPIVAPAPPPPPPPPPVPEVKPITTERTAEWLSSAMERGQLDNAVEKYDMAAALKVQAGDTVQASIAWSASAFTQVLRGDLAAAETRLRDADANKGEDPIALAYADLARAMLSAARGELPQAMKLAKRCATSFATPLPVLSVMCLELQGTIAADQGDVARARAAFNDGLVIAKQQPTPQRAMALELALAQLEIDEQQYDAAVARATAVKATAIERNWPGPAAQAWLVILRARLAQSESQEVREYLEQVKPDQLQSFRIQLEHTLASGQTTVMLGDPEGLDTIRTAGTLAVSKGFVGLALEARLSLVEALTPTEPEVAQAELRTLLHDARAGGYGRIVRLAETISQR